MYHLSYNPKPNSDHHNQNYQIAFKTSNPPKQTNIPIIQQQCDQVSRFMYFPSFLFHCIYKPIHNNHLLNILNLKPLSSHLYHQTNKKHKTLIFNTSKAKQNPRSPTLTLQTQPKTKTKQNPDTENTNKV